ncbi:type III-D CRISPR-associated RAMP protein Csx10 [Anthocerotibacter panamensis]|uniref:type III-D CRISPR-associated RAMP protein Csx10 n=1 Tax=Anthocerotibacter panamensis TaxID=2857077 RepID=UPI001C403997|nr:CRISPR-associated RAMP protein Csx10 [Anthocerotibacter panamensis]
MKRIQLTIKALAPLAIGRQKPGGSVSETEKYIPGTVLRGAIAAQVLQQFNRQYPNQPQDLTTESGGDFQKLFLGEKAAIFHNAYPAGDPETDDIRVLPATAVSSKTKAGFQPKKSGVFDTLIDRFCAEGYGLVYDPDAPGRAGERVEPYSGFYTSSTEQYTTCSAGTRMLTRVGINRRRATAEEQILYSIEVLNETATDANSDKTRPTLFQGAVLIEDDALAEDLKNFVESHPFRLGGGASRGLGKVEIRASIQPINSQVTDRIEAFNCALSKRWDEWKVFKVPARQGFAATRTYFTLDIQSEAILTDQWRRTVVLSPQMLCYLTKVDDTSLQLHTAYTSYDYRSGWNSAWGLMKDVDLVTNRGGVYLFSTEQPQRWTDALKYLELWGIGERTVEGFGQVRVCDEFHLIFREEAK